LLDLQQDSHDGVIVFNDWVPRVFPLSSVWFHILLLIVQGRLRLRLVRWWPSKMPQNTLGKLNPSLSSWKCVLGCCGWDPKDWCFGDSVDSSPHDPVLALSSLNCSTTLRYSFRSKSVDLAGRLLRFQKTGNCSWCIQATVSNSVQRGS